MVRKEAKNTNNNNNNGEKKLTRHKMLAGEVRSVFVETNTQT